LNNLRFSIFSTRGLQELLLRLTESRSGARVCDPQRLDLQGDVLRLTEPRSTFAEVSEEIVPSSSRLRGTSYPGVFA